MEGGGRPCRSKSFRSAICVFGLKDLVLLDKLPHLLANKIFPDYDFAAALCWSEAMFNRSYLEPNHKALERVQAHHEIYANMPQVNKRSLASIAYQDLFFILLHFLGEGLISAAEGINFVFFNIDLDAQSELKPGVKQDKFVYLYVNNYLRIIY